MFDNLQFIYFFESFLVTVSEYIMLLEGIVNRFLSGSFGFVIGVEIMRKFFKIYTYNDFVLKIKVYYYYFWLELFRFVEKI